MSPDGMSWKAQHGDLQLVLRQLGALEFQIEVGDGTLTHYHPATGCDFNTARIASPRTCGAVRSPQVTL